jgi:hypothetical protein
MELAIKENKKKADLPVEKLVLEDLHKFLDVFNNNKANRFSESNVWDHKIDMRKGFEPKSFKNYVTTLILNEYRQSSNSSVLVFWFKVQRQLRVPIARYCLSVELVRVRSSIDF